MSAQGRAAPLLKAEHYTGGMRTRLGQSCETAFYLGEQALLEKRMNEARMLIKQAAEICPRGFMERGPALAEHKR